MLPDGYTVERDSDNDWVLIGPEDVIIFSVPGEPVVLGAADYDAALIEAEAWLRAVL